MPSSESASTVELARAVVETDRRSAPRLAAAGWSLIIKAHLFSLLIHGIVVFNALVWDFSFPQTDVSAQLQFAKGKTAQEVEVQLSMAPMTPSAMPAPQSEPPPVAPQPVAPAQDPAQEPAKPEPFEKNPEPKETADAGTVEGRSPQPTQVLDGSSAEPADPVEVARQQTPSPATPAAPSFSQLPGPPAKAPRAAAHPSVAASTIQPARPAQAQPMEPSVETVTLASIAPTIVFEPPLLTPPTPTPPTTAAVIAKNDRQTAQQLQQTGVTTGSEAQLVKPRYSALSIRAGEEGLIVLEIEVLANGSVGFVNVIESPGYDRLEKAAIEAVRRSRFTPAHRNGQPIREVVRKSFSFRLEDP